VHVYSSDYVVITFVHNVQYSEVPLPSRMIHSHILRKQSKAIRNVLERSSSAQADLASASFKEVKLEVVTVVHFLHAHIREQSIPVQLADNSKKSGTPPNTRPKL